MGGGLESRYVGRVYGLDGAVHYPNKNFTLIDSKSKALLCQNSNNIKENLMIELVL